MTNMNDKIVIFGGTGFYGRKVVEKLVRKNENIRVVSRNRIKAVDILGPDIEILEGDVVCLDTIKESLIDVKAIVICLSAMSSKLIRRMTEIERDAVLNIIAAAQNANVPRLVYMSGYEMRESLLNDLNIYDFGAIKIEVEKKISESDLNWTILGDAPAFEIFFAFLRNGTIAVPGGGIKPFPTISPDDVGEITAQTVLRNDLSNVRLKLTGPQAYSFPEVET